MLTTGECDNIVNRLMTLARLDGRNLAELSVINRDFVQFACIFDTGDGFFIFDCEERSQAFLEYRVATPPFGYDVTHRFEGFGSTSYLRLYNVIAWAIEEVK